MRRAQLFVITMIFLAELVFAVQALLIGYGETESSAWTGSERLVYTGAEQGAVDAVQFARDCSEIAGNIADVQFGSSRLTRDSEIQIGLLLDCAKWQTANPVATATISVTGRDAVLSGEQQIVYPR